MKMPGAVSLRQPPVFPIRYPMKQKHGHADKTIEVIIETPRGSAEKYSYDTGSHLFRMKKILPAGMVFPYDFGFIPNTSGEDGDPLDAVVISSFRSYPGISMHCRIIGVIEARQSQDKKMIRNDRFLAIPVEAVLLSNIHSASDLPRIILEELEQFFINYNALEGKKFKTERIREAGEAFKKLQKNRSKIY